MVNWKKTTTFSGPEKSPGFLLWQVSTLWRRNIEEALRAFSITHPQFVLLASVAWLTKDGDFVSQVEIARQVCLDINMTSQVLRTLEKNGYITRVQKEGNERSKFPRVTKEGSLLLEQVVPVVEEIDEAFFSTLQSDVPVCVDMLTTLRSKEISNS